MVRQNQAEKLARILSFYLKYFNNDKILFFEWLTAKNQHLNTPLDESIVSNIPVQTIDILKSAYKICGKKFDFFGKFRVFHLCIRKNDVHLLVKIYAHYRSYTFI